MEHLFLNCHGEWNALLGFLSSLPFLGVGIQYIRAKFKRPSHPDHQHCNHE